MWRSLNAFACEPVCAYLSTYRTRPRASHSGWAGLLLVGGPLVGTNARDAVHDVTPCGVGNILGNFEPIGSVLGLAVQNRGHASHQAVKSTRNVEVRRWIR